jgi:hypothetical protein
MNQLVRLAVLCVPVLFPACSLFEKKADEPTKSVAASSGVDLGKLLAGIKDGPSAQAAKSPLEAGIAQLKTALAGAKQPAAGGTTGAAGGANNMVADVLAKFGLGSGSLGVINALMQNQAVTAAIGPALQSLKSLIPAM